MRRLTLAITGAALFSPMLLGQAGPYDRQKVDTAASKRGSAVYTQYCIKRLKPLAEKYIADLEGLSQDTA